MNVADLRIVQTKSLGQIDQDLLLKADGDLDTSDALATAVIVALLSDRRADESDDLPSPDSTDLRGWWGDTDAEEIWGGDAIGSRLWTLARSKIVGPGTDGGSLVAKIDAYIREALQWFIDAGVVKIIDVAVTRVDLHRIDALIVLYRQNEPTLGLRFEELWSDLGAR